MVLVIGLLGAAAAIAIGQGNPDDGRIGPSNRIQPSGGALTKNGRFLWAVDAGRGHNDVRIVEVEPALRCRSGRRGLGCRRRVKRRTGRTVQSIPMPGASGG